MKPPIGPRAGWRVECGSRRLPPPLHGISVEFGVDVDAASTSARNQFAGTVHELIDSSRARIWNYDTGHAESRRRVVTTSAYAADRIALSPTLTLDASLRDRSWCTAMRKGPRRT